jgi:hypothetical protein
MPRCLCYSRHTLPNIGALVSKQHGHSNTLRTPERPTASGLVPRPRTVF